ncbi:Xaa-Pro peptidase family protein [Mesorhizobium sp. M0643]|uniref:M24 family metallopeptidase n=1 Tax=Mesorhizobium sp. M0643 TaxID=2956978 RepID=UPI003337A85B
MAKTSPKIPFTGPPFEKAEYEDRQRKVFEAMEREELDALLVTAHGHLYYLSGYPGTGGYFAPFPLIMVAGQAPIFVARKFDVEAVRAESCVSEVVAYAQEGEFAKVCANVLRKLGLQGRRVGLELGCWNLAPNDVFALKAELPDLKVVDATHLVPTIAAVKSDLEIKLMREAMVTTELAVTTFQRSLRENVTEDEVFQAIVAEVRETGGLLAPAYSLLFGSRLRLPHGTARKHLLRNNDAAFIEIGGTRHAYAAALCRSAVLGRNSSAESLHKLAEEALEAAIVALKPGVTTGEVDAAARSVLAHSGRQGAFRHRTGYQVGINWSERGNLSLEPDASQVVETGMTFHMPIILFDEQGYQIGCSDTVVVNQRGAESLSTSSSALYRA